jgi:hypothetical protein
MVRFLWVSLVCVLCSQFASGQAPPPGMTVRQSYDAAVAALDQRLVDMAKAKAECLELLPLMNGDDISKVVWWTGKLRNDINDTFPVVRYKNQAYYSGIAENDPAVYLTLYDSRRSEGLTALLATSVFGPTKFIQVKQLACLESAWYSVDELASAYETLAKKYR